jgi:D-alanyl-D-alanine carboxypeptidase
MMAWDGMMRLIETALHRRQLLALLPAMGLTARANARSATGAVEKALQDFVRRHVGGHGAPGVSAAAAMPDGRTIAVAGGLADPATARPMTPSTRLMSGSTGKTFAAATAMALVDVGRLNLDAPIAPLFADEPWYARLPNARDLTLRMLLQHSEGFPQFLDQAGFQWTFMSDAVRGRDIGYSPRKMLSFILDEPPLFPAGARHSYSDLGYHLAGLAMEKASGKGYYDLLDAFILSRLKSPDVIAATSTDLPGLATGFARGDIMAVIGGMTGRTTDAAGHLRHSPKLEYAGGGLALTPRAPAQFYWKLANGLILAPASFEAMMQSRLPLPGAAQPGVSQAYGLGMFITKRPELGRYISHSGYYPGYSSNVAMLLDHNIAVAVQQNSDHGDDIYAMLKELAANVLHAMGPAKTASA